MAKKYFTGATSGAYATATNWQGGVAPVDGDEIWLTELATQSLATGLTVAAVAWLKLVATRGYKHSLGSVGNEAEPANGIGTMIWEATGEGSEGHFDTEIDYAYIDTPAQGVGVIMSGTTAGDEMTELHLRNGLVTLGANFDFVAAGRIQVDGGRLVIPAGVTMGASSRIIQTGGKITSAQTIINLILDGGEFVLDAAAAATLIAISGSGLLTHKSTGTIADLILSGGVLDTRTYDLARTITNAFGRAPARAILGYDTAVTNGWKKCGYWAPEYSHGEVINKV